MKPLLSALLLGVLLGLLGLLVGALLGLPTALALLAGLAGPLAGLLSGLPLGLGVATGLAGALGSGLATGLGTSVTPSRARPIIASSPSGTVVAPAVAPVPACGSGVVLGPVAVGGLAMAVRCPGAPTDRSAPAPVAGAPPGRTRPPRRPCGDTGGSPAGRGSANGR